MGSDLFPSIIALGGKDTYFLSNHYSFTEIGEIEMGTSLSHTINIRDLFDYHHANVVKLVMTL